MPLYWKCSVVYWTFSVTIFSFGLMQNCVFYYYLLFSWNAFKIKTKQILLICLFDRVQTKKKVTPCAEREKKTMKSKYNLYNVILLSPFGFCLNASIFLCQWLIDDKHSATYRCVIVGLYFVPFFVHVRRFCVKKVNNYQNGSNWIICDCVAFFSVVSICFSPLTQAFLFYIRRNSVGHKKETNLCAV